jgi:hypothetical protein
MGSHDPFGIWNTNYGQKKGRKSICQFDSWPLKVRNHLDFFACKWRATYNWKALDEDYNFTLDIISIKGLHTKLWAHKVVRVPVVRILGLPLGSPRTKCHLDVGLVKRQRVYYRGRWWLPPSLGHGESCEFEFARGSS